MDKAVAAFLHSLPLLTAYSQLKDRARHERRGHIAKVLAALLVEDTPLVQETVDGLLVRSKADAEGEESHAYRAAIRVWKYALDSNLSIRQTLRLPRHCTQRDSANTRTQLTRYTAETLTVGGGSMHHRSAAVTELKDVAVNQVQLAIAKGNFKHNGTEKCIRVVVVPDATPLWKTSVSKADVFVHVWGEGVKAAGHIARWAMWWCMDGPDDAGCLLAIDDIGKLNEQVVALQRDTTVFIDGESSRFAVFLSGDGKLMAVTNGGGKCWCCDDVTILVPLDHVLANVCWGSFLRTIKTDRRVGVVVHGACRVTNAFKKRLSDDIARWLVGVVGQRAMAREFHEIWAELLHEARSIPAAERKELLPRKAKEGTFDINTARLFWDRPRLQQRLISALQTHFPTIVCNGVCMYVLVAVFLRDFCALQKLWRKKEPLTDVEVASAKTLCQSIGTCWQALGWKPTPWVHWTVAHSHYFLAKYRTLYLFSSVPAEHRHRRFQI